MARTPTLERLAVRSGGHALQGGWLEIYPRHPCFCSPLAWVVLKNLGTYLAVYRSSWTFQNVSIHIPTSGLSRRPWQFCDRCWALLCF